MIVGVGMDLVDVPRVAALLAAKGDRALRRLFTAGEAAYAAGRAEPARHLAARFAAKEAAYKALAGSHEARGIGWQDVEVTTAWDGRPQLVLHGRAAARAAALGVVRAHLTLTHADAVAGAVVILEAAGAPPSLAPADAPADVATDLAPGASGRPSAPAPLPSSSGR